MTMSTHDRHRYSFGENSYKEALLRLKAMRGCNCVRATLLGMSDEAATNMDITRREYEHVLLGGRKAVRLRVLYVPQISRSCAMTVSSSPRY